MKKVFSGEENKDFAGDVFKSPVWLLNQLISAGLKPVLSHTKIPCRASYYRQFSTYIKIQFIKLSLYRRKCYSVI